MFCANKHKLLIFNSYEVLNINKTRVVGSKWCVMYHKRAMALLYFGAKRGCGGIILFKSQVYVNGMNYALMMVSFNENEFKHALKQA